jgi:uncharacterized phage protein (TIGR01671 family)
MNNLKARAWDTINKKMFTPQFLMLDEHTNCLEIADLDYEKGREYSPNGYMDGGLYTDNNDHWILMLHIGLKDIKRTKDLPEGQEIYEGDIVKVLATDQQWPNKLQTFIYGVIVFKKGLFLIEQDQETYWQITDTVEVIGNIYQNPEILV